MFRFPCFSFLRWPLAPWSESVVREPVDRQLERHVGEARYSVRLLRYWWAAQAIREEAAALGRPLTIVDYGSGRGWLKRFVGPGVQARWIAVDWQPQRELLRKAGYDEVYEGNFDRPLPLEAGRADVVVALHVFEHLPRPAYSLHQLVESLAAGGCVLAGSPTLPSLLARFRQAFFRRQLARGRLARGGHINSLSPDRWCTMLEDAGLTVELVSGSHLIRHTGNPLENSRWWVRLNQLWGALFPSLGSEICVQARKPVVTDEEVAAWTPQVLHTRRGGRLAVVGVAAAVVAVVAGLFWAAESRLDARVHEVVDHHLREEESGHLLILAHQAFDDLKGHPKVSFVQGVDEISKRLEGMPENTHVVLHESKFEELASQQPAYRVHARSEGAVHDFYLLQRGGAGTPVAQYLSR